VRCLRQRERVHAALRWGSVGTFVLVKQVVFVRVKQARASRSSGAHTPAYVSVCQHTSAYVGIRQHTSAYVGIRVKQKLAPPAPLVRWVACAGARPSATSVCGLKLLVYEALSY
jgi:hypothetical protein